MNVRLTCSVILLGVVSTVYARELDEPCDLASVQALADWETVNCNADTLDTPYTLSADTTWSTQALNVPRGSKVFDLSGQTLGVRSFTVSSETSPYLELKGGTVDGISIYNYGIFTLQTDETASSGRTFVFNGSSVLNYMDFRGMRGRDNVLVFENGAAVDNNAIAIFGKLTDESFTNNLVKVTGGSTFGGSSHNDFDAAGPGTAALMRNRLVVEGNGSNFIGSRPWNNFYFSRYTSGNEILVRDGGRIDWYNAYVGASATAKSNTVMVTGAGSSIVGEGELLIGSTVGADYNRVIVTDGGDLKAQTYAGVEVGSRGSFNELIVSNATLSRAYWVTAGVHAGASNNVVRIYGDSSVTSTGTDHFFGSGCHNVYSFEHGTFHTTSDVRATLSRRVNGSGEASTNNTFQVVDGASIRFYDFSADVGDATNTVFVGADSTLAVSHDMPISGSGNRLVISNGTVKCSRSIPGLRLGVPDDIATEGFAKGGNELVFQGTHPLVLQIDPNHGSAVHLYDHSVLRFDVPEEGYAGPLTQNVAIYFYGNGTIRFSGVEKLADSLEKTTTYRLLVHGFDLLNPEEGASLEKIIDAANIGMPRGSYAYRDGNVLCLRVKPIRGMAVIIR